MNYPPYLKIEVCLYISEPVIYCGPQDVEGFGWYSDDIGSFIFDLNDHPGSNVRLWASSHKTLCWLLNTSN